MQPKISFCLEWKMVSNLMRHSANACTTCVEATNLTRMQLFILEYLYQHQEQDVFQRDLEAEFHVRRSTVTGILKGMEKKGLIQRLSVEEDESKSTGRYAYIRRAERRVNVYGKPEKAVDLLLAHCPGGNVCDQLAGTAHVCQ